MKKILICSIAVLLINGCTKTPEEKIVDLYQDGVSQIAEFQYKKADSTFNQIFEIDQGSATGLLGIAKLHDTRLQYFDAIKEYITILTLSTDHEDAFVGLYNAFKNLGYYEEALEEAVHYNKNWHSNSHTKYIMGEAFKNLGELKRATGYFEQAVKSEYEYKSAAQFMFATTLHMQGFYDDALKEANEAIASGNDNTIYYNAAAEYFETIGLIDSAMTYNKKIFTYDKSNIQNAFVSFKRALKNNYLADARSIMQNLKELQAEKLLLEGFRLFYALHIDDKNQIRTLSQTYKGLDTYSLSGRMYELYALAELSDKMTVTNHVRGVSAEIFQGMYSEQFGDFFYHTILMLSLKYEKNPTTISQFESVIGLKRNRMEYKLEFALNKHIIGEFEECYDDLKMIESAHQDNPIWISGTARIWGHPAIRKYDVAEEKYKKALSLDPQYIDAFNNYLEMLERIENFDKALKLFEMYPQFEKNNFTALTKTKYLFLNKKFDDGLSQFKKYYQYTSGNIVLVNELLLILKDYNQMSIQKSLFEIIDNSNPDALLTLANDAQVKKQYENSFTFIDKLTAIEPENNEARILKANALYYTGKKTEAYDLFEKNLKDLERNPRNLLYYSHILSQEGIDFAKASNMARQAVFEGHGAYKYIINLADIYYKMGRYDLCRGEASKAQRWNADIPYVNFRLGMAYAKSDDIEKWSELGKESLTKAIELGLEGEFLEEAKQTLKNL